MSPSEKPPAGGAAALVPADGSGPATRLAPWRATGVLVLLLSLGLAILLGPQHASRRISVDVLDLLPRDAQDPTIRLARQTANGRFGRTMLMALTDSAHPDRAPVAAAAKFAASLGADPAIAGTFAGLTDPGKERLGQWFFERRLPLRMPAWFDAHRARWEKENLKSQISDFKSPSDPPPDWLAKQAAADLQNFLTAPEADAAQGLLPKDPLLLIPGLLNVFGGDERSTRGVSGGALTGQGADGTQYALVYAEIKNAPLEHAGQAPVFAALDRALVAAKTGPDGIADLRLRWSGVNKFAAESREKAEREINILTNLSLAASCVVMLLAFRNLIVFAYLLLPIATAAVWSLVVCFTFFDRLHVVAIIFTTVLLGIAMDYGIYALTTAQRATVGGLRGALREVRRPLIAGCLTSVGGFVFLILTNLPMLQQMGLAVATGLLVALGLDFLYLPWMPALRVERGPAAGVVQAPKRLDLNGRWFPVLALGLPLLLLGWVAASRPHWNDDIRALQSMDPALQDEESALRKLFGQSREEHLVLTFGHGLDEAFDNVEKLNATLDAASSGPADSAFNLGRLFPGHASSARVRDYLRAHPEFTDTLRRALDADFNADAFAPFWDAWAAYLKTLEAPPSPPSRLLAGLRDVLPLPLQNLWSDEDPETTWLATRVSNPLWDKVPRTVFTAPNTPVDQVETLNGALRRYRVTAMRSGGIGLALIAAAVLAFYGVRRGGFMLLVPLSSMFFALGTFGFMGQPLSLLHVIAHLLGFCLASDYSIFLASPGDLPHATRRAVRLAGLTALVSFTVLSFSKLQALHDICLTVALVIAFDLLLCEVSYRLFVKTRVDATA